MALQTRCTQRPSTSCRGRLDSVQVRCSASIVVGRRQAAALGVALLLGQRANEARAAGIEVLSDTPGIGSRGARRGDLALLHYVGTLESGTGGEVVFDSTRGGLKYRDGGQGVLRPVAITVGGSPVPGICEGLLQGLDGMSIGGRRVVRVPASLGFGNSTVLAPYALVPAGATLRYDIELIRLSDRGPDELTSGLAKCGTGGAAQQSENCDSISYAEFLL